MKELFKYSDLLRSKITYKVGINQVSHFINLFKSRENTTPLDFERKGKFNFLRTYFQNTTLRIFTSSWVNLTRIMSGPI